jgi:hypothetical protein
MRHVWANMVAEHPICYADYARSACSVRWVRPLVYLIEIRS